MTTTTLSKHIKGDAKDKQGHKLSGIILTLIGIFWFAKIVGWISVAPGGSTIIWPLVVIGLGVFTLVGPKHRRKKHAE
jgi:hypothetical protein